MDNQEKLAASNTQAEDKQNNNKTQCVFIVVVTSGASLKKNN
jgi:hypothetical protein